VPDKAEEPTSAAKKSGLSYGRAGGRYGKQNLLDAKIWTSGVLGTFFMIMYSAPTASFPSTRAF
jgi:hypothetical protein